MKVGLVTAFIGDRPSGARTVVQCFARALRHLGADVVALDNRSGGMPGWQGKVQSYDQAPGPMAVLRWINLALPSDPGVDAVLVAHAFGRVSRLACPQWLTVHDLSPVEDPGWHRKSTVRFFRHLLPRVVRNSAALLTHSPIMAGVLKEHGLGQATVVPLFATGSPGPVNEGVLQRLGVQRPYLLYLGVLEPRKNLVRLVQAFERLAADVPDMHLVLAGPEGWNLDVRVLDRPRVRRIGTVREKDKLDLYRGAAGLVYPSLYEGFGLPVLEALECGCPVLSSTHPVLRETAAGAAIAVDPLSVAAMAAGMKRLWESPPPVGTTDFSLERTAAAMAPLLQAVHA